MQPDQNNQNTPPVAGGVYKDEESALSAIRRLKEMGYKDEEIGIDVKDPAIYHELAPQKTDFIDEVVKDRVPQQDEVLVCVRCRPEQFDRLNLLFNSDDEAYYRKYGQYQGPAVYAQDAYKKNTFKEPVLDTAGDIHRTK